MTSKIVVNNIEADTGISTITFINEVTAPTFNGNIVGTAATFSGNVDIAGVLTYEDVTNVDSVGIITAQAGIHVTSGNVKIGPAGGGGFGAGSGLEVERVGAATIRIEDTSSSSSFEIQNTGGVIKQRLYNNQPWSIEYGSGEKLRITSAGNVGIGTDNPDTKLTVKAGSGDQLRLDNAGERYTQISLRNNGTQKAALWLDETTDLFDLFAAANYGMRLLAGGAERLLITSDGKVGINQSTPQTTFHSSGTTNGQQATFGISSSGLKISTFQKTDNDAGVILDAQQSSNGTLTFATKGTERLRIDSAGNVDLTGGGNLIINYDSKLYLEGDADDDLNAIWKADTENTLFLTSRYNIANIIDSNNDDAASFWSVRHNATTLAGSGELMRVQSDGKVGINETDPDTQLHIKGAFSQTDSNGYLKIENTQAVTNSGSNASLIIRSHTATSQFMNWENRGMRIGQRIIHNSSTGDLYFTAGNDTVRLTINASNGNFTGSSSADISDGRLKENIQDISASDAVTIIKGLQGRTFTWKEEAKMGTDTKYGFIAQEVETVIPNLVHQNMGINRVSTASTTQGYGQGEIIDDYSDAYKDDAQSEWSKSVEKTGIIPVLVEALKDAFSKIETLETQNTSLEARLTALEG